MPSPGRSPRPSRRRFCAGLPLLLSGAAWRGPAPATATALEPGGTLTRLAFGSCCHQDKPAPIWRAIGALRPQVFLFLGDNIYGDSEDMAVLGAKYDQLDAHPDFRPFREGCPVWGVWDDHDYGVNDGGADYPRRADSQRLFADFFRLPADSPVRRRPGIYDARLIGPPGRRVQLIFLDTRYFRGPLVKLPERGPRGPYAPNRDPAATVLGDAQWRWLAERLREPAELRIVLSSTQVLPQDHAWECWENFPAERARLLRLLRETGAGGVLFLSGDRHLAEIMRLSPDDPLSPGVPVWEVTSSSLTNPGGGTDDEPNRHRVSPGNYRDLNFGLLEIDWERGTAKAGIRNVVGAPVFEQVIVLKDLRP